MTDNELIAQFMGLQSRVLPNGGFPVTMWHPVGSPYDFFSPLEYEASWDALMPVIERACEFWRENVDQYNKPLTEKEREWDRRASKVGMLPIDCGIKAAHINVVEFIKWYNQQKP